MKKVVSLLLVCIMLLSLLVGCGKAPEAQQEEAPKTEEATTAAPEANTTETSSTDGDNFWEEPGSGKTIGMTIISFGSGAWNDIANACTEYTREGDTFVPLSFDEDVSKLVNMMEDFVAKDYDAIAFTAHDPDAVQGPIEAAKKAGIPLFNFDSPVKNPEDVVCYIGQDNYSAAFQAGEMIAKAINYKGKIAEWGSYKTAVAVALQDRAKGFEDAIAQYPDIEIVANPETPWPWQIDNAMSTVESALQAHPEIQGIYVPADILLEGVAQAFQNQGIEEPAIVSLSTHSNYPMIQDKTIYGMCDVQYDELGKIIMKTIYRYLDGDTNIEPNVESPVRMVDRDNVEQYIAEYK